MMMGIERYPLANLLEIIRGHSGFICSLRKELLNSSDSIQKPSLTDRISKANKIKRMNEEFFERIFLYLSQNNSQLGFRGISILIKGLAISGFKNRKYKEMISDLSIVFCEDLSQASIPIEKKNLYLQKFIGHLQKVRLPELYFE
jgi:hypothetical protein